MGQVLAAWRPSDGDAAALSAFLEAQFVADPAELDALLDRFEQSLEAIDGARRGAEPDPLAAGRCSTSGRMMEVDKLLTTFDAGAHVVDDLFATRLAFVALLNFPLTTLERAARRGRPLEPAGLGRGPAHRTLSSGASRRSVNQQVASATAAADLYIADDNIFAHHLVADGKRLFPKGMRLLSHWNLRDQIKAEYATADGLPRQRLLQRVMERIVTQTIPLAVIDDPRVDWDPIANVVKPAPAAEIESGGAPLASRSTAAREPDTRYARLLDTFHAARAADPYVPTAPTHVARKFDIEREIPEARVVGLLQEVVSSPLLPRIARLVEAAAGEQARAVRPLVRRVPAAGPIRRARARRARPQALPGRRGLPEGPPAHPDDARIRARAGALARRPHRGRPGARLRATPPAAAKRGDFPRLRTRVGKQGMDYKGFNIAIHELGHNVEQVFSLYEVDHTLLQGVPNNAFTEAIAFVFQRARPRGAGPARPHRAGPSSSSP